MTLCRQNCDCYLKKCLNYQYTKFRVFTLQLHWVIVFWNGKISIFQKYNRMSIATNIRLTLEGYIFKRFYLIDVKIPPFESSYKNVSKLEISQWRRINNIIYEHIRKCFGFGMQSKFPGELREQKSPRFSLRRDFRTSAIDCTLHNAVESWISLVYSQIPALYGIFCVISDARLRWRPAIVVLCNCEHGLVDRQRFRPFTLRRTEC